MILITFSDVLFEVYVFKRRKSMMIRIAISGIVKLSLSVKDGCLIESESAT